MIRRVLGWLRDTVIGRPDPGWDTPEGHAILREAAIEQTGEIPHIQVTLPSGEAPAPEEVERAAQVLEAMADGVRANERKRIERQIRRYAKQVRSSGRLGDIIAAVVIEDVAGRLISGNLEEA